MNTKRYLFPDGHSEVINDDPLALKELIYDHMGSDVAEAVQELIDCIVAYREAYRDEYCINVTF